MAKKQKMFRLDDQMIVQIDLYARLFNTTDNAFITQAIYERVKKVAEEEKVDWQKYTRHDRIPGGLLCAMFTLEGLEWDESDNEKRKFVLEHAPFFYANTSDPQHDWQPHHKRAPVLWTKIEEYIKLWKPGTQPYAAGHAMQDALLAAAEPEIPEWGGRKAGQPSESHGARAKAEPRRRAV